ncbi:MAG: prepilin peptidase [Deltaproteobacteria bacterium]|nr:prepilin peptidase [Deltaproteobacteria bacterium]
MPYGPLSQILVVVGDAALFLTILVCAISDIKDGIIPNKITYSVLILGLVLGLLNGGGSGFIQALFGAAIGFALLFFFYLWGGFGGGDVKLMAAIGALKGYPFVIYAAFYSAIIGGIYSLAVVIWRGKLRNTMMNIGMYFVSLFRPNSALASKLDPASSVAIPFGFCICIGTLWAVLEGVIGRSAWQLLMRF